MLHLYDRATMAHALTLDLDPQLHRLLTERITALGEELIDWTEYLVVEAGDTEEDIIRHIGFSPLVEPIEGARFGEAGFHPHWDWLADHGGWFEMIVTFGSTFAYVLLIERGTGALPILRTMCREFAQPWTVALAQPIYPSAGSYDCPHPKALAKAVGPPGMAHSSN